MGASLKPALTASRETAAAVGAVGAKSQVRTSARARRRAYLVAASLLLLLITIAAIPIVLYPIGTDQSIFAMIGNEILDGGVPYVDGWDPKPPAVYYIYAALLGLFGQSVLALRIADFLVVFSVGFGLLWLGARLYHPRMGLLAILIFAALYLREPFWGLTQNDGMAMVPMTAMVVCALKASELASGSRRALAYAFATGVLAVVVLWFKYPFALFVVALVAGYGLLRGRRWGLLSEALAFVAGGGVTLALSLGYLAAIGGLEAWLESLRITAVYSGITRDLQTWVNTLRDPVLSQLNPKNWGWAVVLAALWPFVAMPTRRRLARSWLLVWLWLLSTTAIMLAQGKGFGYHWQPIMPPLALLAAFTVDRLLSAAARRFAGRYERAARVAGGALLGLALLGLIAARTWDVTLPLLRGQQTQAAYLEAFQVGDFVASDSYQVVEYLKGRLPAGESLFIYGTRPDVYFLGGYRMATRFPTNQGMMSVWAPPEWQTEVTDTLRAEPPGYVLVLQDDPMPMITGHWQDSVATLADYPEFRDWLDANYVQEAEIGHFLIWRHTGPEEGD